MVQGNLDEVLEKFQITIAKANDLRYLEDYQMILLIDDSGSMNLPSPPLWQQECDVQKCEFTCTWEQHRETGLLFQVEKFRKVKGISERSWKDHSRIISQSGDDLDPDHGLRQQDFPVCVEYQAREPPTRWAELKESVALMVDIGYSVSRKGLDLYFLNRHAILGVQGSDNPELRQAFSKLPSGSTPLTEALRKVRRDHASNEFKYLLFILTDGEPDGGKERFIEELRDLVEDPEDEKAAIGKPKFKVQIMACTGDDEAVAYLDDVDYDIAQVDVTDDFFSERVQILKSGIVDKFERADWCMKAMLGPVNSKFDKWDEKTKETGGCVLCGGSTYGKSSCAVM